MRSQKSAAETQPEKQRRRVTTDEQMEETIVLWINLLDEHHSFRMGDQDQNCPYGKAIRTFQDFTDAVIEGLRIRDDDAVGLIDRDFLKPLYRDLDTPRTAEKFGEFHKWVYEAMTKHPHRRNPSQVQWLAVVEAQQHGHMTLKQKSTFVTNKLYDWFAEVHQVENLIEDPDHLYLFRNENGIVSITHQDDDTPAEGDECQICANQFDSPGGSTPTRHAPQRAPCGHVLCFTCFSKWLERSSHGYTCPVCRACLVCGRNECLYHTISREPTAPMSMAWALYIALGQSNDPLYGLSKPTFWSLREMTRSYRAVLQYYAIVLSEVGILTDDPVYQHCVKHGDEIWAKVFALIKEAVKGDEEDDMGALHPGEIFRAHSEQAWRWGGDEMES